MVRLFDQRWCDDLGGNVVLDGVGNRLIEIRQMQLIDVPAVAAIELLTNPSPWTAEQFQAELSNPASCCDLLFEEDKLAAFFCCWQIADELQIQNIATAPDFRRKGYADRLLQHVLSKAIRQKVVKAFLEVRVGNVAARTFYEKSGFTVSGIRPKYYADNEDALLMELDLQA